MELENEKGIFNLGSDKISVERTNPLLNDQGSLSLTYPIPRTKTNDYLLGFPSRFERRRKYDIKTDVNIRAGLLNENATLQMTSVDNEKVEATFLLYESTFYAKIKEITLPTVFEGVERWFDAKTVPLATRISNMLNLFETMIGRYPSFDLDKDFTLFPIASDVNFETVSEGYDSIYKASAYHQNMINNYTLVNTSSTQIKLVAKTQYTYTDSDGNSITLPVGFGISPFLRLGYILRKVFSYFGFELDQNIFDVGGKYRRVVVLNNTQDAIMLGYLIESQLVPDCTISDFLDIVRESFNADFFIDVPSKTARIVFFDDILNEPPDMDLSPYLKDDISIEYHEKTQVKLLVTKGLPNADTAIDTYDGFLAKYPQADGSWFAPIKLIPRFNAVFKDTVYVDNSVYVSKHDWISSMNFDYYTEEDIESEDHTIPFESPITLGNSANYDIPVVIIDALRRLNGSYIIDGETQSNEDVECPLIACIESFDSYIIELTGTVVNNVGRRGNIEEEVDPSGLDIISLHTWGTNGTFAKFWKNYDQLLRNSWHTVTAQCRIPAKVLQSWDFTRMKLINGQPMIANSLKYELSDDPMIDVEVELKTVKVYEDE